MHLFGIAGYSGGGKTTLIEKLVPLFVAHGLKVSVIKQTHHDVDLDQPGKDSWRHRAAGCHEVLLASSRRWALLHELRDETEPAPRALAERLAPCDLVLVEGFRHAALPKLEVFRAANGKPFLHPSDPHVVALASDVAVAAALPRFSLDDAPAIAEYIRHFLELA
jgi:molybdopterin-guanine dinucleotide biosynthesis protein B